MPEMRCHMLGELDLARASELRSVLERYDRAGADPLVVDLAGVVFIDAAAMGVLAAVADEMERAGKELRVVNATPLTRKLLGILDLTTRVHLEDPPAIPPSPEVANYLAMTQPRLAG